VQEANSKVIDKIEPSKTHHQSSAPTTNKVVGFVGDVKQELKKIEWTTGPELKFYTKVVLASMFLFALFIYLVDVSIQGVLSGINLLLRATIG
jgi:preprotein translocase SecE subunit